MPNFFVTMSHFPIDDSEMSHIIEHSEYMHYTTVKLVQHFRFEGIYGIVKWVSALAGEEFEKYVL